MRNFSKSTIISLSSFLETKNCVLHLRTILDWQRIQKKVQQTKTWCTLCPGLRDKERTQSRCSTWQNRRTKRVPYSIECVEDMLQKSWLSRWTFYRYSRSIPQRSSLSWITTRSRMDTNLQKKTIHIVSLQRKRKNTKDNGILLWTNQAKMGLWSFDPIFELLSRSQIVYTASHANKLKSLFLQNNSVWHHSSSTSWWDKNWKWAHKIIKVIFFLLLLVSFHSRWRSTVTDGVCRQGHLTRHFSHANCTFNDMHITLHGSRRATQCVCVRASFHLHVIHDVLLSVVGPRSVLLLFLSVVYLFSSTLYLFFSRHSIFNVDTAEGINHCASAQRAHGDVPSSHRLWAQPPRQLRLLRDFCNDLPGWIRRHRYGAFVLVRCRTRRWDYGKSAIFTTVHSGARRTSEPETSLSLLRRKFVATSVLFRTHKYGETRVRT